MSEYSADAPLSASSHDRFQRWPFARRVARVIASRTDPESIVIGINGAWGEGKTTVFNFIAEELKGHPSIVCFRFNPWRFPDENRLIRDFFQSLAGAVDKKLDKTHEKLGNILGKYASIPAGLAGAGDAVRAVGDILSTVDLEELKTRVETVIQQSGKRVVVLMDDIDRLDKNEIQTVFRLVKLVADFRNTAYVLAFDAEMVASALQEKYSSRDPGASQNFLEKIIQVPLDLPQIPKTALREFSLGILQGVLNDSQLELSAEEVGEFVRGFDGGLLSRMGTPRMAKRYGNILAFSLPILEGEVHPVDLMLIEGMRILYPKLYDAVRDNIDTLIPRGGEWKNQKENEQATKQVLESALAGMLEDHRQAAIKLLKQLFPLIEGAFGGMRYADGYGEQWTKERRVTSRAYFQRYFSYAIPEGQISDRELADFVASLATADDSANLDRFRQLVDVKNAPYVIGKLRADAEMMDAETAEKLAGPIIADGTLFPNPNQMWSFTGTYPQAAMLVNDLIGRVTLLAGRERGCQLAVASVSRAMPLDFACEVYSWIRFEKDDDKTDQNARRHLQPVKQPLPEEDRGRISRVLVERIKQALCEPGSITAIPPKELLRFLSVWATTESRAVTSEFIARGIEGDHRITLMLLDALRPTQWSMTTGLPSKSDFERHQYDSLCRMIEPEIICRSLASQFGPYKKIERYPTNFKGEATDRDVADQFRWIHTYVIEEEEKRRGLSDTVSDDRSPQQTESVQSVVTGT